MNILEFFYDKAEGALTFKAWAIIVTLLTSAVMYAAWSVHDHFAGQRVEAALSDYKQKRDKVAERLRAERQAKSRKQAEEIEKFRRQKVVVKEKVIVKVAENSDCVWTGEPVRLLNCARGYCSESGDSGRVSESLSIGPENSGPLWREGEGRHHR